MTTGIRKTHDFCWLNLMSPQGEAAKSFFGKLFGWTYGAMPGVPGGSVIHVDGKLAGAVMDLEKSQMPPGTPPVIGVFVRVDDADATAAKIKAAGGAAEAPMDALENGRMVLCADPSGARFGLWQPKKQPGFDCDSHAHGAPTWIESITTDVERARKFYVDVFGWKPVLQEMPGQGDRPGMTYTSFLLGDVPIGGMFPRQPFMENIPAHWGVYFAVNDTDTIAASAKELGGEICMPPTDIPGVGRFALLRSPQGVMFHVLKYLPRAS